MTTRPILKLNLKTQPKDLQNLEELHLLKKYNTKTKADPPQSTPNIVVDQQALIAEKIEKRRLEFNGILEFLQTNYPNCFNKKRKLLAIGIHKALLKLHHDVFSKAKLSRFFAKYCRSTRYKKQLIVGAIRINLDGSQSSQVTETEVSHLSKLTSTLNNIRKEKP